MSSCSEASRSLERPPITDMPQDPAKAREKEEGLAGHPDEALCKPSAQGGSPWAKMAPHLRPCCQPAAQSPRQGMEIMRSRGVGPGEREQVEAIRGAGPTRGRVRRVVGLESRAWGLGPGRGWWPAWGVTAAIETSRPPAVGCRQEGGRAASGVLGCRTFQRTSSARQSPSARPCPRTDGRLPPATRSRSASPALGTP